MMDYTDRHCRYLLRLLSPAALLYTEMMTSAAIVRGHASRLLEFDPAEHPVALQLGGSDPRELAVAARVGAEHGYDEINLNCGCPSDRVQSGRFGACLMAEPALVAECVSAMRAVTNVPITVKCRIGIEPSPIADDYEFLHGFVERVSQSGCDVFIVHARRAVLSGLSPRENREIPPLRYDVAARLRADFPRFTFILNGGIRTVGAVREHLTQFDGVMLGREAYHNPYILAELHRTAIDPGWALPAREDVVQQYAHYCRERLAEGHRLRTMVRHIQGLYAGLPNVRAWRRFLSEQSGHEAANADVILAALRIVRQVA